MRQIYIIFIVLSLTSCRTLKTKEAQPPRTSIAYLKLPTSFRVRTHLFVGKYLSLFSKKEMIVFDGKTSKHIRYETLPILPCNLKPIKQPQGLAVRYEHENPTCIAFPDWVFNHEGRDLGIQTQRTRVENNQLIIALNRHVLYTFNADGILDHFEEGDFLEKSPYSKMGWREEKGRLFYQNRPIENDPGYFHFSGNWLLVFQKKTHHLFLYQVRTGAKVATFHKTTIEEFRTSSDLGFSLIEGDGGFYVYKNQRPLRWYGQSTISLKSEKGKFCYVYKEQKKCIDDPDNDLKHVTENAYYRTYVGKWIDTYIEVKK